MTNYQDDFFTSCVADLEKPEGWTNLSWHNDACPSWGFNGYQIFIDHADANKRELGPEIKRFHVMKEADYGEGYARSFDTNSWDEVLKIVENNLEDALHQTARDFMDKHSKPNWKTLSLDEWLAEYGEHLSAEVSDSASDLLEQFDHS
tara:strand:- start:15 stop:458 length:444 start_codon:yes stop_codon:yes gene_type:complete